MEIQRRVRDLQSYLKGKIRERQTLNKGVWLIGSDMKIPTPSSSVWSLRLKDLGISLWGSLTERVCLISLGINLKREGVFLLRCTRQLASRAQNMNDGVVQQPLVEVNAVLFSFYSSSSIMSVLHGGDS